MAILDPGSLYIMANASDNGTTRPVTGVFWESPSLWMSDNYADQTPPGDAAQANVNRTRYIHVQVNNMGAADVSGAKVQVWVANPTVGLQPGNARPSSDPFTSTPFPAPIPAGKSSTIAVQWTPTQDDLTGPLGSSHLCIGANCYVDDPQSGTITEGVQFTSQPAAHPYDAAQYLHNGQRNITLAPAITGGMKRFKFDVANPGVADADFTLAVEEIIGDQSLDVLGLEQVLALNQATVQGVDLTELTRLRTQYACGTLRQPLERALIKAGGKPILVGSHEVFQAHAAPAPAKAVSLSSRNFTGPGPTGPDTKTRHDVDTRCAAEARVHVRVGTVVPATLDVTLNDATKPGGIHTFRLTQHDQKGAVVGGIRFMALAATQELLNPCGRAIG